MIEFVPLRRDQGAVCRLPDLIHVVNKLQNWVSGKVLQISTEPTVGCLLDTPATRSAKWMEKPFTLTLIGRLLSARSLATTMSQEDFINQVD